MEKPVELTRGNVNEGQGKKQSYWGSSILVIDASWMGDGEVRMDAILSLHNCICDDAINRDRKYRKEDKFGEREGWLYTHIFLKFAYTLDMTWWKWHCTSVISLPQTHTPSLIMRKTSNSNTVHMVSTQYCQGHPNRGKSEELLQQRGA